MARLIVKTDDGEQTVDLVPGQTLTIGRDSANKIPLPGAVRGLRRHCRVGPREGGQAGWEVADLGSTNKTRVGGRVVKQRTLTHGDEIEIGSARVVFEDEEEAARLADAGQRGICFLEWAAGDRKGEKILLEAARITIGRRETNTLALDDRMVSGHHAEIDRDVNGYTIRDLGSTNGTVLNGDPVSEALLTHGARLRIGNGRFVFKDPSMKDVEVALDQFEEDEGWGMMGEIDLSRARGSRGGLLAVLVLLVAAGAGGWWLSQRPVTARSGVGGARGGLLPNGDFADEDLAWRSNREEDVRLEWTRSGRRGGGLLAENQGQAGTEAVHVVSTTNVDAQLPRPVRFRAQMKKGGEGAAVFYVAWTNEPPEEEGEADEDAPRASTSGPTLTWTEVLGVPGRGSWTSVDETRLPPAWATAARIGMMLEPGARVTLDDVSVERLDESVTRAALEVPRYKSASLDGAGGLHLTANAAVLMTSARPVARLADGTLLDQFRPDELPTTAEGGLDIIGHFAGAEGDIPATISWTATPDGLRAALACEGAEAVGVEGWIPAGHLQGTVSVLGAFLPQRLPVEPGQRLEGVSRMLAGAPVAPVGQLPTLLAFVTEGEKPVATVEFLASVDEPLVRFRQWLPGATGSLDVMTDFRRQNEQADRELAAARNLMAGAPGQAILEMRRIAQAYPFVESIRDEAVRQASRLEDEARANIRALDESIAEFRIYESAAALEMMNERATKLAAQFLGDSRASIPLAERVEELVAEVRTVQRAHEVEAAGPDVDRLERLALLLAEVKGYEPLAAIFFRTMVSRYEAMASESPDIARRVKAADDKLEELESAEGLREALPPRPGGS